ncbi:MAG TPA: NAD(P)-dependent alcohol dehydrogenase [Steroidobacteraceae bacterium]|nr:NAD(P)-dependent alcohol dehydrogenase [Steroidobacteraceae bacterium]
MRAVVCTKYGPPEVLQLQDVTKPMPGPREVLVRIRATTVSMGDFRIRSFTVPALVWLPARLVLGIRGPRQSILGIELAGQVEAVGAQVTRFAPGDRIFAATLKGFGAYAEYRCLPENGPIATIPRTLSYEEAAAVPIGARTALHYLRRAAVVPGQEVLIFGASGSVGTYAVQLAKHFGARVTAVSSTANLELLRSLGADLVIDYTAGDFSKTGSRYDVVFDAVGKCPFADAMNVLKAGGTYLNCTPAMPSLSMLRMKLTGARKLILGEGPPETPEALEFVGDLIAAGKLRVVVDRRYTLDQMVEAHKYVDQGHKKGNVVVSVA